MARFAQPLLTILLGFALMGCGSSAPSTQGPSTSAPAGPGGPSTVADVAAYKGADRQQMLEDGARKEGHLTWYTTLAGQIVDDLPAGFKARYPYIQMDVLRTTEDDIITRVNQEAAANKPIADTLEVANTTVIILNNAKLTTPFFSPNIGNLAPDMRPGQNGLAESAVDRVSYIDFGYNTTKIPADAVPKAWSDVGSPTLAGKLTLAGTATGYRWVGLMLHLMGDDAGTKFLQQMASQLKPSVQNIAAKGVMDLIAKGEVPASTTIYEDHVEQATEAGAPVKWAALDPAVASVASGLVSSRAPHPHAAMLWTDYLFGEGQQILQKDHYVPGSEQRPYNFWIPEAGKTPQQVEADANNWAKLFKDTFGG